MTAVALTADSATGYSLVLVHDSAQDQIAAMPAVRARLLELTGDEDAAPARGGEHTDLWEFLHERYPFSLAVIAYHVTASGLVVGWGVLYGASMRQCYADVFVDPAFRGRGLARAICRRLQEATPGAIFFSDRPVYRAVFGDEGEEWSRQGEDGKNVALIRVAGAGHGGSP